MLDNEKNGDYNTTYKLELLDILKNQSRFRLIFQRKMKIRYSSMKKFM